MNEMTFKYLDKGRQIDLNRLLRHTYTTYGMSALLEQLIDLMDSPEPYMQRLVADLKKTLTTYEARYELDPEDNDQE